MMKKIINYALVLAVFMLSQNLLAEIASVLGKDEKDAMKECVKQCKGIDHEVGSRSSKTFNVSGVSKYKWTCSCTTTRARK